MTDEIRAQMQRTPFVPFAIRTSDGHQYDVPTLDHIFISPRGGRVIVVSDKDVVVVLPALHISSVVHQANGS